MFSFRSWAIWGIIPLTQHEQDVDQAGRDRPAAEIEVTPAMREAGAAALFHARASLSEEETAEAVYRAMAAL